MSSKSWVLLRNVPDEPPEEEKKAKNGKGQQNAGKENCDEGNLAQKSKSVDFATALASFVGESSSDEES